MSPIADVTKSELYQSSSDAAAALVGSLGLVPSVNAGDSFVMGEPYVSSMLLYLFVCCAPSYYRVSQCAWLRS